MQFNEKPLLDLAENICSKIKKEEADLTQSFKVIFEGTLTKKIEDDREIVAFDGQKSKWIVLSNDETGNSETGEIAKR